MLSLDLENLKQSQFDVGWGWGGVGWGGGTGNCMREVSIQCALPVQQPLTVTLILTEGHFDVKQLTLKSLPSPICEQVLYNVQRCICGVFRLYVVFFVCFVCFCFFVIVTNAENRVTFNYARVYVFTCDALHSSVTVH